VRILATLHNAAGLLWNTCPMLGIFATVFFDGFVKSPIFMSFRAKREILWEQAIEKIGFLPTVEMTNTSFSSFYELITFALSAFSLPAFHLSPLSFEL
jgi:hypothetical protein